MKNMGLRIIRDMFGPALLPCCGVMVAMDRLTHDRQWLVQHAGQTNLLFELLLLSFTPSFEVVN